MGSASPEAMKEKENIEIFHSQKLSRKIISSVNDANHHNLGLEEESLQFVVLEAAGHPQRKD